ncbi:MAG: phage portal protein, partial [Methylocystaceae bacterium]|nr:phage portal protein [Methylocystaceae bacterium]
MGLLSAISSAFVPQMPVKAELAPPVMSVSDVTFFNPYNVYVLRSEALAVPSIKKARDLICGIVGTTPFHLYRKSNGEELGNPLWLEQPDRNQPRQVTMAYTADSLFFYGVAFWEVLEQYNDGTGRPSRFAWVSNERVTPKYNDNNTLVVGYQVDGKFRPMDGLGSLITFQSLNDGILNVGGRTIRAALDAQYAASVAAKTPLQSGFIKNTGADLPEDQIVGLLQKWKSARLQNNIGYLNSALDFKTTSFSPKEMGYNEMLQFLSTEIARLCNIPAYMLSSDM